MIDKSMISLRFERNELVKEFADESCGESGTLRTCQLSFFFAISFH